MPSFLTIQHQHTMKMNEWKYVTTISCMKPQGAGKERERERTNKGRVQCSRSNKQASMNDSFSLREITCPQSLYHFEAKRSGLLLPNPSPRPAIPMRQFPRVLATQQWRTPPPHVHTLACTSTVYPKRQRHCSYISLLRNCLHGFGTRSMESVAASPLLC